jgi:hypothetical protein
VNHKLKVFGTLTFHLGVQARTIAATTNQKEFARLIHTSLGYVRDYACETANPEEVAVAMGCCETAFAKCPTCGDWKKIS